MDIFRNCLTVLITLLVSASWLIPMYLFKFVSGPVGILYIPISVLTGFWVYIVYEHYYK